MSIDVDQFRDMFFEEAADYVATFEKNVLLLENAPDDDGAIREMFRAAHSLKGCSATLGLEDVAAFTHELETLLDRMRAGQIEVGTPVIRVLLEASDLLGGLLESARTNAPAPKETQDVMRRLHEQAGAAGSDAAPHTPIASAGKGEASPAPDRLCVRIVPHASLLVAGLDPLPLLREVADICTIHRVELDASRLPSLADLTTESCYFGWTLWVENDPDRDLAVEIREIFEFVEDTCEIHIDAAVSEAPSGSENEAEVAPTREESARPSRQGTDTSTLRVPSDRIDEIINLVGELVIAQGTLHAAAGREADERLTTSVLAMGKTLHDLQQCALAVRTMPLMTVFCRFPRLVRDLADELDKPVKLRVQGGETELDKSVIEGLSSPLTHILRNAVDHGIESPSVRRAAGKPDEGMVEVRACQGHGSVVIEVEDDGKGLDAERIRERAISRGLLTPEESPSDERLFEMIFEPGFSTAETVSDVSGRGVGMDAARMAIEELNGTLQVGSTPGAGTCVRITLPLTLAVLDGFSVQVGAQRYVLPMMSIVEVVKATPDACTQVLSDGQMLTLRDEQMPLVDLNAVLDTGRALEPWAGLVVVVETLGTRVALVVDDIEGQVNVVMKGLDESVREHPALLGATIRGDGAITFILDLAGILRVHRALQRSAQRREALSGQQGVSA